MSAAVVRTLARFRPSSTPFPCRASLPSSCRLPSSACSSSLPLAPSPPPPLPEPHLDTLHHQDTFHHHRRPHRGGGHDPSHQAAVSNLLYNTPPPSTSRKPHRRTLCALVTNEAGVLSRVSGVLAGRGVNIDSLVVSETETPGLSRMTIVLKGGTNVDQARKQLEDLVQVWAVVEFAEHVPVVERELLLLKLSILPHTNSTSPFPLPHSSSSSSQSFSPSSSSSSSPHPSSPSSSSYPTTPAQALTSHIQRQAIVELTDMFQGRVLDLTPDMIMIELTGKAIKIDAFIELVRPFGIKELARSGVLAMLRGHITGVGEGRRGRRRRWRWTRRSCRRGEGVGGDDGGERCDRAERW